MEGQRREKGEEGAGRGGRGSAGRRTAKPRQEAGGRRQEAGACLLGSQTSKKATVLE